MKLKFLLISFFKIMVLIKCSFLAQQDKNFDENKSIIAEFCINQNCIESTILKLIHFAKVSIDLAIYRLDHEKITDALIDASNRGVKVRIVSDFSSEYLDGFAKLKENYIDFVLGNKYGIMHNKYAIVDKKYLLTGSSNFTKSIYNNFNDIVLIRSKEAVKVYEEDFNNLYYRRFSSNKILSLGNFKKIKLKNGFLNIFFTPYQSITYPLYSAYLGIDFELFDDNVKLVDLKESKNSENFKKNGVLDRGFDYDNDGVIDFYLKDTGDKGDVNLSKGVIYRLKDNSVSKAYHSALNIVTAHFFKAKKSIDIICYSFTEKTILDILEQLSYKGIIVNIWVDYSQYLTNKKYVKDAYQSLSKKIHSFKIFKKKHSLLHNKIILIDKETIIMGSLNLSNNAFNKNDENFIVIEQRQDLALKINKLIEDVDSYSVDFKDL